MTSYTSTDIDIDVVDRARALQGLAHIPASLNHGGKRSRHNSGVYLQNIPVHPLDGFAVWDSKSAGQHGFFKFDLLSSHSYTGVRDEAHLDALLAQPPMWELLDHEEVVGKLSQINNLDNSFPVLRHIKPRSVEDLAVVIALIRPGKRHLRFRPRAEIDRDIWQQDEEGYVFKRSHAIAYAMLIVVQLNLLVETC